jgi:hypothetical protein
VGVVVAIVVLVGLTIMGFGAFATSRVFLRLGLEQFRHGRTMPRDARRRGAVRVAALMTFVVAAMTILIVAPFGQAHTFALVFGGFAVLLFAYLNCYVIWLVRQNGRKK